MGNLPGMAFVYSGLQRSGRNDCAHFVLNATSLQLIPALYLESRISMMEAFSQRA